MTSHLFCLTGLEERLQGRLSSICRSQLGDGQDVQNIAEAVDDIKQQQQMYKTKVEEVQTLMEEMRRKLDRAKADLISAVRGILVISQIKMKIMVVVVMKVCLLTGGSTGRCSAGFWSGLHSGAHGEHSG